MDGDRRSGLRVLGESVVCLMLAVLLFRQFIAEGYMISTGSMAPYLLGFHKRVVCPSCGFPFALGVAFDESDADNLGEQPRTSCPNCHRVMIDVSDVPRNHGDQLLVDKQVFLRRNPRRWEVVVFRNPSQPDEPFVKRVVGLPGERIQLVDGEVYIDGRLERKSLDLQREMRLLTYDATYCSDEDAASSHWTAEGMTARKTRWVWRPVHGEYELKDTADFKPENAAPCWLEYRRPAPWGAKVRLTHWPTQIDAATIPPIGMKFDPHRQELSCTLPLSEEVRDYLLAEAPLDPEFRLAITQLSQDSRYAPIVDRYAYNVSEPYTAYQAVRDVALSARVHWLSGTGRLYFELTDGDRRFVLRLDAALKRCELLVSGMDQPVKVVDWPAALDLGPATLEFSMIDQQICAALNGNALWAPWPFETVPGVPAPRRPARIGGEGLHVTIDELRMYRDVYYTTNRARHAANTPYELAEDEYFVLGDNSPLSHDSRRWDHPGVPAALLVGKPFLVHLPSKPGRLTLGGRSANIRVPDWDRVRFLK